MIEWNAVIEWTWADCDREQSHVLAEASSLNTVAAVAAAAAAAANATGNGRKRARETDDLLSVFVAFHFICS